AAAHDSGLLKLSGDGLGPGAGGDVDVNGLLVGDACGRADGGVNGIGREGGADERYEQQGCEDLQAVPFVLRLRAGGPIPARGCILRWSGGGGLKGGSAAGGCQKGAGG